MEKSCPLELVYTDDTLMLREDHMGMEENQEKIRKTNLHCEAGFTGIGQVVEKSVIDLFGVIQNDNQVISDIHFLGTLKNFNVPLIKNSWKNSKVDYLKLPVP